MIDGCFTHCQGIGPKTDQLLRSSGFYSWDECFLKQDDLPLGGKRRAAFLSELEKSRSALSGNDLAYFTKNFPNAEHWRILSRYFQKATFFDIETTGLSWQSAETSVIAAYHRGKFLTFARGENLDDFLDIIDDSELLVSFNGLCFDVPFLENTFNIPPIETPHVDLRWVAYHRGFTGGLKLIEKKLGIERPASVRGVDGLEAVDLYYKWQAGDREARERLITYCAADVAATYLTAERILAECRAVDGVTDAEDFFLKIKI